MNTLLPLYCVDHSPCIYFLPPQGSPVAFPRVLEQPTLHFLSVRRQTGLESKMNHSDGGRVRKRTRLGFQSFPTRFESIQSLMGYSVDQICPTPPILAFQFWHLYVFIIQGGNKKINKYSSAMKFHDTQ